MSVKTDPSNKETKKESGKRERPIWDGMHKQDAKKSVNCVMVSEENKDMGIGRSRSGTRSAQLD